MKSLKEVIDSLPEAFTAKVLKCEDVALLEEMLFETTDEDEISVIAARIANINYLVA